MDNPTPPNSSSSPNDVSGPVTPPPARPERKARFLGSALDLQRAEGGARAIATSTVLAFLVILLVAMLFWLRDELGSRVLVTAATPRFDSPLVPPLDFAQQDIDRMRSAPGLDLNFAADQPPLPNFATTAELSRLLDQVLRSVNHDTLIVFVRLHSVAVGDENELYLLPADVDPLSPEQRGVKALSLLQSIAHAPARNKLVLMDVGQVPHRLQLGWFPGELREQLLAAFDAAAASEDFTGNLVLVCANGDGQSSRSSVAVQQSIFGGLAAYCLHGGAEADGAGPNGDRNGLLSAAEIAAYLEQSVAVWSQTYPRAAQIPFSLAKSAGSSTVDDFNVAAVNEFLSVREFFLGREGLEHAGEAENERRRQAAEQSAQGGSPAGGTSSQAELPLVPTTEVVIGRLRQSWQRRELLAQTAVPSRRPRHWALYHQELRRAESLLLAGRLEDADAALNSNVSLVEKDLEAAPKELIRHPWSVSFTDLAGDADATARWGQTMQAAILAPTRLNLDRLRGAPFVEVEIVRRAAGQLVTGTSAEDAAWSDPKLLGQAVVTRSLAEQVGRLARPQSGSADATTMRLVPELFPLIRDRLETVDRLRNAAEHELFIGRADLARDRFEIAAAEYAALLADEDKLERQLQDLHLGLIEAAPISEWLALVDRDSAWRSNMEGRLEALLRGAVDFRRDPRPEHLSLLVALRDDLRRSAIAAAQEAVDASDPDPVGLRAALELPFLDSELRFNVVRTLVRQGDAPQPIAELSGAGGEPASRSVSAPYLVSDLARALAVNMDDPPSGDAFRKMLSSDLNQDPVAPPPGATGYEQFASHLVRAPFQTTLLRLTRFQPVATDAIVARMTMDHLEWQLLRLNAEQAATAADMSGPQAVIMRNLREADPAYQESLLRPQSAFSISTVRTSAGESAEQSVLSFSISCALDLVEADDPQFVIDGFPQRLRWNVTALRNVTDSEAVPRPTNGADGDTGTAGAWRHSVPVRQLALRQVAELAVDLKSADSLADAPTVNDAELPGWIALADGSRYWLPIPLPSDTSRRSTLKLAITEAGGEPLPDTIRLFPNQRLPVQFRLKGRRTDTTPVTFEIASGGFENSFEARPTSESEWAGSATFRMPVVGAELLVRAVAGSEVIDSKALVVEILSPRSSFATDVRFDSETRTVLATIRRLVGTVAAVAVPVQLSIQGVDLKGGSLEGELPPDSEQVTLQAVLAQDNLSPTYEVEVGVCGVPGMFHYTIDAVTGVVTPSRTMKLEVQSPRDGATFAFTLDRKAVLPISVSADSDGTCLVNVGIDRNRDGNLSEDERLDSKSTWSGKMVRTQLVATADPAEMAIESQVGDVVTAIPASGLVGRHEVLAELHAGDQVERAPRTVYFLKTPPVVTFVTPQQNEQIAMGDPFTVTLQPEDPSYGGAIARVEIGVDRNNNGAWDEGETLSPMDPPDQSAPPFAGARQVSQTYDSSKLLSPATPEEKTAGGNSALPGRLVLMARTSTSTQNLADPAAPIQEGVSPIARRLVRPISQDQKAKLTGEISGTVVTADGLRQRGVQIVLGELTTETNDQGRFVLREVPAGKHVVKARRGLRAGEVEVEVISGQSTSGVQIAIVR